MLPFCAKTIVKESRNFEVARLKKKKEAFWSFCEFVVWYFYDDFLRHWARCVKHSMMNGTFL